jgi:hypothetical protein
MAATSRKAVEVADRLHLSEGSNSKGSDYANAANWARQVEAQ